MERKTKAATETSVYLVIIAAILVVVNVIAYVGIHKRIDVTKNERFTLSQGSGRLVSSLKNPFRSTPTSPRACPSSTPSCATSPTCSKQYKRAGGGKFEYTLIEAKTDEQRQAAKEAGLKDVAFGEGSETGEDQASITQGYMGLVFKYGSEKDAIPILSPDRADGLEFWITNKIRESPRQGRQHQPQDRRRHRQGRDQAHRHEPGPRAGRRQGGPSIKAIIDQAFPFYKIEDVDLKDGDTEINKELDGSSSRSRARTTPRRSCAASTSS